MDSLAGLPSRVTRRRLRVLTSIVLAALMTAGILGSQGAAMAVPAPRPPRVWTPPSTPRTKWAPVPRAKDQAKRPASIPAGAPTFRPHRTTLPAAGHTAVAVKDAAVQAGSGPLYLAAGKGGTTQVDVQWAGAATARSAGISSGLMWGLTGGAAGAGGGLRVELDSRVLDGTSGGALSDRLRLVALPPCAMTTPSLAQCRRQTPVTFSTDPKTGRLSAMVALPAIAAPNADRAAVAAAPAMVLAAQPAPAGSAGTYAATPTNPSNQWSQGGATGGFNYAYPIATPPSLGGAAPDVTLGYSSQSVDGQTAATNNQSSWIGDGWSYDPGYIERSYQPCDKAGIDGSNDLCWAAGGSEVTLNQTAFGGQLVRDDDAKAWHLAGDNGATVKQVTNTGSTNNGAYNGEYWLITTQDGTRYYYGAGNLPAGEGGTGHDPDTHSAWTQPVYCPKSGDPCYKSSTGTGSFAPNMTYRWNLDYVIDPHGNTTVYTYGTESNYYARGSAHTNTSYVRGGYLKQINYGWRTGDVAAGNAKSAAEVVFGTGQRCTGPATECSSYDNLNSDNATDWPDTPFDLICKSTGDCSNWSPAYFSTYRLKQIQTLVNKSGTYTPVDTWALDTTMLDPGDSTGSQIWLNSITQTGNDGTAVSLPPVTFTPFQYGNRVPNSGTWTDYWHPRIVAITDETGGEISVTYTTTTDDVGACDQSPTKPVLPSASNDDMLCYRQFWNPPGSSDIKTDWFEKYVVSQISETDLVSGAPARISTYKYVGKPAWHRDDSPLTPSDQRTWNQFRGFETVITTTGSAPDPITQTSTKYLRGMDGDYTSQTGADRRSASVKDSAGDVVVDANQYADRALEVDTYDHADGTVRDAAITVPWSARTAAHAEDAQKNLPDESAWFVETGTTIDRQLLTGGSWRTTKQVDTFSGSTGLLQRSDRQGDVALVNQTGSQETCTTHTYATAPATGPAAGLRNAPAREVTVSVPTGGPIGAGACPAPTPANTITDTLAYYDGNTAAGVVTGVGDISQAQVIDHWTGNTPGYVTTSATPGYDVYGRVTSAADARGLVTDTTYTPPQAGQLPTTVQTTIPAYHLSTTTTVDQSRQVPTKTVDPNGNNTSAAYDGLGRLTKVWRPGRTVAQPASTIYTYSVNGTVSPSWTETRMLRDNNSYNYAFTILNGFGQKRQTQTQTLDGANGSVVTDTFYDTHGWARKTSNPFPVTAFPSSTVYPVEDGKVPGETLTTFDGRGRTIASAFYAYAQFQWQSKTAYPGEERTDVTPPTGGAVTSTYTDALGRTSGVWRYSTPAATGVATDARIIGYTIDPAGKVTDVAGAGGAHWTSTYDLRGHVIAKSDPDAGSSTSTYYADGDLQTTTDSTGRQLTYTYDTRGRKTDLYRGPYTATPDPANDLASWTYDTAPGGQGQQASSTSYTGGSGAAGVAYTETIAGYTNQYAPTGTSVTIPDNVPADRRKLAGTYSTAMTYLPISGRLWTTTYTEPAGSPLPAETVTNLYDVGGNLNTVSGAADYQTSATADQFGNNLTTNLGDSPHQVVLTTNYDVATGKPAEQFIDKQTAPTHVDDITAYRNTAGQITAVKDVQGDGRTDLQCYGYDQVGELTSAWTDNGDVTRLPSPSVLGIGHCATQSTPGAQPSPADIGGPAQYWQTYSYNAAGNRTGETDHDTGGDAAKDVNRIYHYNNAAPDELSDQQHGHDGAQATDTYTYYGNGDTKTRSVAGSAAQTFTYDDQDRTASVTDTAGKASNYVYDAAGSLLLQSDTTSGAGTITLYLGTEQFTLSTATGKVAGTRTYTLANGVTEVRSSDGTLNYQFSSSQDTHTLVITADAAQRETRRSYTPYGATRGTAPTPWIDNRGFQGQPADDTTGLDLLGARNYDSVTGRFLQIDPVLQTNDVLQLGGYSYAGNNPVTNADPTGTDPCSVGGQGCVWYPQCKCYAPPGGAGYKHPPSKEDHNGGGSKGGGTNGGGSGVSKNPNAGFVGPQVPTRPLTFEPRPNVPVEPVGPIPLPVSGLFLSFTLTMMLGGDSAPDPYEVTQQQIEDQERGCAARTNSLPMISYLPLDNQGRARGAFGCLTNSATTFDTRDPRTPPGYDRSKGMDRGHLMARQFGGTSDLENISPMYADVNHETAMGPTERDVRARLDSNQRVFYAVIPKYFGAGTELKYPVPFAYNITIISASGSKNYLVPNQPNWTH